MRHLFTLFWLVALMVFLAACSGPAAQPLHFNPAPWQDGEISIYRVADAKDTELGTAQWAWARTVDGWAQTYELNLPGRLDRGEAVVGDDLSMRSAWREVGGNRYEARYAASSITITTTLAGAATTKVLKPVADAVDNDVSLQIQRALPLAAGYATRYTDVIPTTGLAVPVKLTVTAAETVTVPAGAFPAWRVELDYGSGKHDAWYGQAAPYPLVKYRNRASGAVFELRSLSMGAAGAIAPPSAPVPPAAETANNTQPPINVPLLLTTFLIQMPLMLVFPLALGWWIRRRFGVGWGVFGSGAATFVASQVIHLPLNYALGLLGGGHGVALWPLLPLALVAGLSSGVCEEGARWLVLRFFAREARGWRAGLQFGAGHGAAEAIIFGGLALVNAVFLITLRSVPPSALGLAGAPADQLATAQAAYWNMPAYLPVVAGLERVFAITLHVALATLVMRAVTRRQPLYLLAAIGLHAATNTWAVWASQMRSNVWVIEGGVALVALFCLWLIWRLREAPPAAEPEPVGRPVLTAADLTPRALSAEELAQRAATSRYE